MVPKTLFGRLTGVLLVGLTLMAVLSTWILMRERGEVLYQSIRSDLVLRTAGIVQLLDALDLRERERLLPLLSTPETRIRLVPEAAETAQTDADSIAASRWVEQRLRRHLGPDARVRVTLRGTLMPDPEPRQRRRHMMGPGQGRMAGGGPPGALAQPMTRYYFIQARLNDGAWVWFERQVPSDLFDWPLRLLATLGILLIGVVVLSLVAVRWVVRPLRELRQAADSLGKDIHRPPLKETGPTEVADTARAFNGMQTRIESYVEDRARILAAVSHDLKTPLTRLRLRSDLLEDDEARSKLQGDLDDMETMVSATLDFMRGTESGEASQPIDLTALLESIRDDARDAGWEVTLAGEVQETFLGRPLSLKRCIGNLVENAVRYGDCARISVQDAKDTVTVTVRDNGPGIPPEMLEKVFDPFVRLEASRAQHTGGTGLGLGIARNIARAHGGDLTLENDPRGGLRAVLTLPR